MVADALAIIALNASSAAQVRGTGWTWVLVYAYALQIYFDFSGYTGYRHRVGPAGGDQAAGELQCALFPPNLTQFWNNWHMTLTQWFRAYFFNPFTRWLRSREKPLPAPLVILITQVSTMVLIGLWHGVTWNFVIWGAWHGLGLFVQNRYSEFAGSRLPALSGWRAKALNAAGVVLTFHYVALGWVWFALPGPALAWSVLAKLFGG